MSFEEDFKNAVGEGKAQKKRLADLRVVWVDALREKMVLHAFRLAKAFLKDEGHESKAGIANGTEVFFRCAGHELKFDFDMATGKIICTSSIQDLDEPCELDRFNSYCVENKLVAFGRAVGFLL